MKRKFSVLIALILALVMSFALIACGNGNGDPNTPSKPERQLFTMQKAADAINALAGAEAVKGTVKVRTGDASAKTATAMPFEKRQNRVRVTLPEISGMEALAGTEMLFDLDSGNTYMPISEKSDEYIYLMQITPQGYFDYIENASGLNDVEIEASADALENMFQYDYDANRMTLELDAAQMVNALIAPMQEVYADGGSVEDLIDAYLAMIMPDGTLTLSSILDTAESLIAMLQTEEVTFDDAVTAIDAILQGSGVEASLREIIAASEFAADYEQIKDRKIADAIQGLLDLIAEYAQTVTDDAEQTPDGTISIVEQLYYYMFEKEVDTTNLMTEIEQYKNLILSLARSTGFDELINRIDDTDDEFAATFKTLVAESVKFDAIKANVSIAFDDRYNIKSLALDADIRYSAENGATLPLLPNAVSFGVELDVTWYSATTKPFNIEYMQGITAELLPDLAMAVVCGEDASARYAVTYETCGATVSFGEINAYYIDESGEQPVIVDIELANAVEYDSATRSFVFDPEAIEYVQTALGTTTVTVYAGTEVSCMGTAPVTVALTYCSSYSTDEIANIPLPILSMIQMNGTI